ncbi:MAG: hypothetical protein CMF60_03840 [Magnetococcales bacterium]|nr:hypothetical protein [Magnetococcales bacterium]MEC8066234.1 lytic murein transglycosylase [Pseudomonadota bacterium]|tara:strand:+ start:23714 stop:24799 length:1086 start_codon:yes stop_codon:yes gene_type:complete
MRTFILLFCLFLCVPLASADQSYQQFIAKLKVEVAQKGLNPVWVDELFGANPTPSDFVIDRYRPRPPCGCARVPDAVKFADNQRRYLSPLRLKTATNWLKDPETLKILKDIEATYGVDKEVIVALWSIESSFGSNQGGHNIPQVLATLAWYKKSKRKAFFKRELINAIELYGQGHVQPVDFVGSWAGAMGQVQFMPSTFMAYAVDYDGDGKKDIWNNLGDAFASAANYLKVLRWQQGANWKSDFTLTKKIRQGIFYDTGLSKQYVFKRENGKIVYHKGKKVVRKYAPYRLPAKVFAKRGVPLPQDVNSNDVVYLYLPHGNQAGLEGYLLHHNFHAILSWNKSSYFAFGILSIMDELKKADL